MDSTWGAAVVGGVAGVITGGLSSLLAPWAQWRVERKRLQRAERVAAIREWRELIGLHQGEWLDPPNPLATDHRYLALRSFMTADERRDVEELPSSASLAAFDSVFRAGPDAMRRAVDRLEREWGLR